MHRFCFEEEAKKELTTRTERERFHVVCSEEERANFSGFLSLAKEQKPQLKWRGAIYSSSFERIKSTEEV